MNYRYLFILFCFIFSGKPVAAVPACPYPIHYVQPDGSIITLRLYGDEKFHYATDMEGNRLQMNENGFYINTYSKVIPDRSSSSLAPQSSAFLSGNLLRAGDDTAGSQNKFLVILVNFVNANGKFITEKAVFENMLNQAGYNDDDGGATGSARDYFADNSFGQFIPAFDVVGPYNLANIMAYYGAEKGGSHDIRPRDMIIEACQLADADGVDFSQYDLNHDGIVDHVCVVYAGYNQAEGGGDDTIWPHEWALNTNLTLDGVRIYTYSCSSELQGNRGIRHAQIGTFCHEFCHALGLPDLYDTGGENAFTPGTYAVMDQGSYNNKSRTPPFLSSFERQMLGWHQSTRLAQTQSLTIEHALQSNTSYWFPTRLESGESNDEEIFIIENRQKAGWDTYIPGHGLAIWHIDRNDNVIGRWNGNTLNNDPDHLCFDLLEADDVRDYASVSDDLFPAGALNKNLFDDSTSPNSKSWAGIPSRVSLKEIDENDGIITAVFTEQLTKIPERIGQITCSVENRNIRIQNLQEQTKIELFGISGMKRYNNLTNDTHCLVTVKESGCYILKISSGKEILIKKVLIQ
ncbi:MAG: M6 family metalloprotease domain-containing protein [Dysgonamonadaceae bacterium]|jgi:M6 family metalloprotease-like protein|nr:M6 family metalloprotease domain-containing protein [Dysgonamonadaceae bacterium]